MIEAILQTLRDTWSGYLEALRVVLPRLLSMLSVIAVGWRITAGHARSSRASSAGSAWRGWPRGPAPRKCCAKPSCRRRIAWRACSCSESVRRLPARGARRALGFETLRTLRADVSRLVPRVVASLAILGIGLVLANVAWRIVLLGAVNAGWLFARAVSGGVHALLADARGGDGSRPARRRPRGRARGVCDRLRAPTSCSPWRSGSGRRRSWVAPSSSASPRAASRASTGRHTSETRRLLIQPHWGLAMKRG